MGRFIKVTDYESNKEAIVNVEYINAIIDCGSSRRIWFAESNGKFLDVYERVDKLLDEVKKDG